MNGAIMKNASSDKMHIAFLLPDQGVCGGARQYMCTMLQSLPPGVRATIIIPDGPLEKVLRNLADDCLVYPSPRRNPLKAVAVLCGIIRKLCGIDCLHIRLAYELIPLVRLLAPQIPVVLGVHGFNTGGAVYYFQAAFIARAADKVIAVSNSEADKLLRFGLPGSKIVRIYNGIKDPLENLLPPVWESFEGITIGTSARLEPEKDLFLLLEAVADIARQVPVRLIIAGEGSLRESLERQAAALGINVCFPGFVPDIARMMSDWDIFCLPSHREPFGFAVAEAMANGLSVVAARAGGPQEIVDDGCTGLMFQPGNRDALAGALLSLCRDRELRVRMGNAGRAKYEQCFCAEAMVNATLEVLRSAARKRGLRRRDV